MQVIALRAVTTEDFMTADWYADSSYSGPSKSEPVTRYVFPPEVLRRISSRITNEVSGVNRVTYDISSKPPGVSCLTGTNLMVPDKDADRGVAISW